jgi:hypothetical protein
MKQHTRSVVGGLMLGMTAIAAGLVTEAGAQAPLPWGPATIFEWDRAEEAAVVGYRVTYGPTADELATAPRAVMMYAVTDTHIRLSELPGLVDGPLCVAVQAWDLQDQMGLPTAPLCGLYTSQYPVPARVTGAKMKTVIEVELSR